MLGMEREERNLFSYLKWVFDLERNHTIVTQFSSFFPAEVIWILIEAENKLSSTQIVFKLLERAMKRISNSPTSSLS